jgi:hypothetical protein
MNNDRAIVDAVAKAQRCPDDQDRHQRGGGLNDGHEPPLDGIEQRILLDQILDRISGQAQFGKNRDRNRLLVAGLGRRQDSLRVGRGIGDMGRGDTGRHARKSMSVDRVESHRAKYP